MITGTLNLTLAKGTDIDKFVNNIKKEFVLNEIGTHDQTVSIEYESRYTDDASALINRDEVIDAFGDFVDDGRDSGECGNFALIKKNGKAEYEQPVYLSQLNKKK